MKKIATIIFIMTTLLSFGLTKDSIKTSSMLVIKSPTKIYNPLQLDRIDLKLKSKSSSRSNEDKAFLTLFISGIAFTTAAILEGSYGYGTWKGGNIGNPKSTYVIPNFWSQTPRQIMMVVGVGMTVTGGVLTFRKSNGY